MATVPQPNRLMDIINSIGRGVPQAATGFVDLAALPFTMSGLLSPKQVVGSTEYLTAKGLLPPPSQSLLGQSVEAISGGLMPLSPAAMRATQAGIEATGKALAPKAYDMLENYMVKSGGMLPLTAYHGTPHNIQGGFDISKVGSGEGAQVYGHGMYFAENPKVAESYAGLSPAMGSQPSPRRMIGGVEVEPMTPQYKAAQLVEEMGVSKAKKFVNDWAKDPMPDQIEFVKGIQDSLLGITKKSDVKNLGTGNLYKVDIPDAYIPTMMDWDKPLGEQSSTVKKAINSIKSKITPEMKDELGGDLSLLFGKDVTPNQFLNTLEIIHPESITGIGEQWLNEAGVKGVRYLDNASRGAGKGTSNFVVFDPTDVQILEKNSKPVQGLLD